MKNNPYLNIHCIILIVFCLLSFIDISAQATMHIEGTVVDTAQNKGIKNAKAILINLRDSMIVGHQNTDANGHFLFSGIPIDTFRFIIEHPHYETREFYFLGDESNNNFTLDGMVLSQRGKKIEEITIFAYKDPVYYKGDTLIYVADSFKTHPNAVVEDLLKKLPGITVESDGSIKSQGKNVARVYVDGDEFFGSDATMATKNLAASSVETVQVYETTLKDGEASDEKIQVIDLKLKDEAKKGYFGKASFGTDFSRFYEGQLLANKFNKKQKISVYFLTANTTKSSLSWQDANQFGIQEGRAYNYNSETDSWEANDNFVATDDGFPLLFRAGAYYTDQVSEKLKIGANYTYSDLSKQTRQTSRTQYFLPDTTYSTNSVLTTLLHSKQHEANLSFKYDIDSTQYFEIEPKFNFTTRTNENVSSVDFINSDTLTTRQSTNSTKGENEVMNIKTRLGYTKKFKKDKRQLRVLNNFVYDESTSGSDLLFSDYFSQTGIIENGIDQQKKGDKHILSNVFSTVYTEPLNKKTRMEFSYELFNTNNVSNQRSFNRVNGNYDDIDSLTSGDFKTTKIQNKLGATFIYDFKKHVFTVGVTGRNVVVNNINHFTQNKINQNVTDLFPKITYLFRINQNSSLRFNSQASSNLPSISLLQPVYDNSNPNSIRTGNENLSPSYAINTTLNINTYQPLSGSYFYGGFYNNYIFNDFVNSIQYDSLGRAISSFVNNNSLSYLGGYAGGAVALIKQVFMLEPNVSYNYRNRVNFINLQENIQQNHSISTGLDLSLYTDVVELSVGGTYSFQKNLNSISSNSNLTNHTYGFDGSLRLYLPWKMEIGTDVTYNNYNNLSEDFDINTFIWNADIEQKFGKNESWIVGVQAYDLLNQNTRIERTSYANLVVDNRTAVISRYFMLNLTYIFNSTFKKQKTTDGEE